jgi:thiamine biosynthesis lipoprotein
MRLLLILVGSIIVLSSCNNKPKSVDGFMVIKGKTMGTKYEIAYKSNIDCKNEIDSLLNNYISLLSLYDSSSILFKFNHNIVLNSREYNKLHTHKTYFVELDSISNRLFLESGGAFNPGLGELYNYWGVGEKNTFPSNFDTAQIERIKKLSWGFKLDFQNHLAIKANSEQKLNFNSLAIGQIVDVIAKRFDSTYHLKNYYINIGGKIRVKGNNGHDSYWPIIVEKPMINSLKQIEFCTLPLKNYSLATANNLKDFHFSQGKRYSQYIDPISGYPSNNELLSATILAPSAIEANAYASTCMVLGLSKAIAFVQKNPSLKAFLIFEKDGKMTYWSNSNLAYTLAKKTE